MKINLVNMSGYEPNLGCKTGNSKIIYTGEGKNIFDLGEEGRKKVDEIINNNIWNYLNEHKERLSESDYFNEYDIEIINRIKKGLYEHKEEDMNSSYDYNSIIENINWIMDCNKEKMDNKFIKDIGNELAMDNGISYISNYKIGIEILKKINVFEDWKFIDNGVIFSLPKGNNTIKAYLMNNGKQIGFIFYKGNNILTECHYKIDDTYKCYLKKTFGDNRKIEEGYF